MNWKIIVGFVVVTIGLLVGMSFLLTSPNKPAAATATSPKAVAAQTMADLGTLTVDQEKSVDFTLTNDGKTPLVLTRMTSSCNCTFGQLVSQGKTSPEYGMHAPSGYLGEIAPGDSATIRVIYRPKLMPVYGAIERELFIDTNDPAHPKLTFSVKATVT